MARTSRRHREHEAKETSVLSILAPQLRVPTAAYIRLSAEQEKDDTIEAQITLVKDYILSHEELELCEIYVDNGYTGTDFDRPSFSRMMNDVRLGKIRCIVVKDLSRFGRNFLETGYYIETILPKLNVRLLSVNDGFDSMSRSDQESISVPIKNMVNEMYAMDSSKKISLSYEMKRKRKEYTLATSMYGYLLDEENNMFIVDPKTGPIVQLLFRWYLEGYGCGRSATFLNHMGILTPGDYKKKCKGTYDPEKRRLWNSATIDQIIRRGDYAGDRCIGKYHKAKYKNEGFTKVNWRDWTVCKDTHEPLITREDHSKAQKIMEQKITDLRAKQQVVKETNPDAEDMFRGKVYCGSCHKHLYIRFHFDDRGIIKPEKSEYICSTESRQGRTSGCRIRVSQDFLKAVVGDQIRLMITAFVDQNRLLQKLQRQENERNPVRRIKKRIASLCTREEGMDQKMEQLYLDLTDGLIDKDDYRSIKIKYQKEREKLISEIADARESLEQTQRLIHKHADLSKSLEDHLSNFTLTRELVESLIERIEISSDKKMEIRFSFSDVFQQAAKLVGGEDR